MLAMAKATPIFLLLTILLTTTTTTTTTLAVAVVAGPAGKRIEDVKNNAVASIYTTTAHGDVPFVKKDVEHVQNEKIHTNIANPVSTACPADDANCLSEFPWFAITHTYQPTVTRIFNGIDGRSETDQNGNMNVGEVLLTPTLIREGSSVITVYHTLSYPMPTVTVTLTGGGGPTATGIPVTGLTTETGSTGVATPSEVTSPGSETNLPSTLLTDTGSSTPSPSRPEATITSTGTEESATSTETVSLDVSTTTSTSTMTTPGTSGSTTGSGSLSGSTTVTGTPTPSHSHPSNTTTSTGPGTPTATSGGTGNSMDVVKKAGAAAVAGMAGVFLLV